MLRLMPVLWPLIAGVRLSAADWPQFQHDQYRTGRSTETVAPPYRLRWVWLGTTTIRNRLSNPVWTDSPNMPPETIIGNVATLPASVPYAFLPSMQPIIAEGKVFVADQDGSVHGINISDGLAAWTAPNPGGSMASGCYAAGRVVFSSLRRAVRAYDAATGALAWEVPTRGSAMGAPVTDGTVVCVGVTDGHVYCIDVLTGVLRWVSPYLGAQVCAPTAMDASAVYACAENMRVYKLNRTDGSVIISTRVAGQSFSMLWPVLHDGLLFVQAAPVAAVGSEYVGEDVMGGATSVADEQNRWRQFYAGQGGFTAASADWRHLTVLRTSDFTEPFVVGDGPYDGCGTPPQPPVVDNRNRLLAYFKTKYASLCPTGAFGTAYSIDISAINTATGARQVIDNGRRATNEWYTWETDNLYGMSVGGLHLFIRQNFRGMHTINLETSNATVIATQYRSIDGGTWYPDVCFRNNYDAGERVPATTTYNTDNNEGWLRQAPAIGGAVLCYTEEFGVVCLERHQ